MAESCTAGSRERGSVTRVTTIWTHTYRGIAQQHYATDPGYATKILQLAHGPHVSTAVVEVRQRAVDGPSVSGRNSHRLLGSNL
jgi:hypothetical protein